MLLTTPLLPHSGARLSEAFCAAALALSSSDRRRVWSIMELPVESHLYDVASRTYTPLRQIGAFSFFKDDRMRGEIVPGFLLKPMNPTVYYREISIIPVIVSEGGSQGIVNKLQKIEGPIDLAFDSIKPFYEQFVTELIAQLRK